MPTVARDCEARGLGLPGDEGWLPGSPWTFRLAGSRSACPALELYESDHLIDIVSSTRVALSLLRGARAAASPSGERTIAWGRMPVTGSCPQVRFVDRRWGRRSQAAIVAQVTTWCWIARADGGFAGAIVRTPAEILRCRIVRGQPWC